MILQAAEQTPSSAGGWIGIGIVVVIVIVAIAVIFGSWKR